MVGLVTNYLTAPSTGGWQRYVTLTGNGVNLPAGSHVLRLVMDSVGATGFVGNFNWFEARS